MIEMTVTDKFKDDSARAAIRSLRGLEQTAIMLETYAAEVFPEVNDKGQIHFGRALMEAAAEAIREAWAAAIKDTENSARADQIDEAERHRRALERIEGGFINSDFVLSNPPDWHSAFGQLQGIARVALAAKAAP